VGPAPRMRAVLVGFGGAALRLQIMTGAALVAIVALILVVFWADREPPAGDEAGDLLRVGVVEGQSVAGYLRSSRDELARLTGPSAPVGGETWALVAFNRYTGADGLPAMLAGAQAAQVYTRVPLEDTRTPVVRIPVVVLPGDVDAGMLGAAQARDREQADYQRLSRALTQRGTAAGGVRERRTGGRRRGRLVPRRVRVRFRRGGPGHAGGARRDLGTALGAGGGPGAGGTAAGSDRVPPAPARGGGRGVAGAFGRAIPAGERCPGHPDTVTVVDRGGCDICLTRQFRSDTLVCRIPFRGFGCRTLGSGRESSSRRNGRVSGGIRRRARPLSFRQ
jgi:hypothetical protein